MRDLSGKTYCFYVDETCDPDGKGFIPMLIVENEPGYTLMGNPDSDGVDEPLPWRWGRTIEDAKATVARQNARLGVTPERALRIVTSSMFYGGRVAR